MEQSTVKIKNLIRLIESNILVFYILGFLFQKYLEFSIIKLMIILYHIRNQYLNK